MLRHIEHAIVASIAQVEPLVPQEDIVFERPPRRELGDIAVPCFRMSPGLRRSPVSIAEAVRSSIVLPPGVARVEAAGGYLNFFLDRASISRAVLADGDAWCPSRNAHRGDRYLIEHTSINPNASPHVGRARNALIGDVLTRLLRFQGFDVEVHYYVNDMGKQIAYLALESRGRQGLTFDQLLELYIQANRRAEAHPAFESEALALLAAFEERRPEAIAAFEAVTELCLAGQVDVLSRVGVHHDVFDWESDFASDQRLDAVLVRLEERGALFTDAEGRLVVDMKRLGFELEEGRYFVLKRANGSSMYGYRDIAYTLHKIERSPQNNMIVLGQDHSLYFDQLSRILRALDLAPPEVVHYSFVLLRDGKMSTRQGKVVLLTKLLALAEARATERLALTQPDLHKETAAKAAADIALAAVRFSLLRVDPRSNVTFDLEEATSFEGDTGPYVQYACARIASILRKLEGQAPPVPQDVEQIPDIDDAAWDVVFAVAHFDEAVVAATKQRNPALMTSYALDLARKFNSFYHSSPVLREEGALRATRAALCARTLDALSTTLELLGIDIPAVM